MAWYEIVMLFCIVFPFMIMCLALVLDERKKARHYHEMLDKQMKFFDVAGEWFYHHKGDKL